MENLKDKLICALKSNAEDIIYSYISSHYSFKGIVLRGNYELREVIKLVEREVKGLYFWQKDKIVVDRKISFERHNHNYKINYGSQSVEISKEEYNEIINLRKEKIKERELKELSKLCSN